MASTDDKLAHVQLYTDANEQLLICCRSECQYALSTALSQVTSHLRDKHNVPDDLRKGLTQIVRRGYPYSFRNPTEVALRDNGSPIHPKLRLYEGFACRKCKYRTISYSEFSRHASKTHLDGRQASRSRIRDIYNDVYLQTWTHSAARRYWIVQKDGSLVRPVADQAAHDHLQSIYEREHKRLELQGRTGARDQDSGPQTLVASRPWMDVHDGP
jgi:hypothetical protein